MSSTQISQVQTSNSVMLDWLGWKLQVFCWNGNIQFCNIHRFRWLSWSQAYIISIHVMPEKTINIPPLLLKQSWSLLILSDLINSLLLLTDTAAGKFWRIKQSTVHMFILCSHSAHNDSCVCYWLFYFCKDFLLICLFFSRLSFIKTYFIMLSVEWWMEKLY